MKINVISYLNPKIYNGGGEMISRSLIEQGEKNGYNIKISSVLPRVTDMHSNPDVTILIDVFNFSSTLRSLGGWRGFSENFIQESIQRSPYIHLSNAYVDVCNLPYLPCSGSENNICKKKSEENILSKIIRKDFGNKCYSQNEFVKKLYQESMLNVYLSPLHQRIIEKIFDEKLSEPYILKPIINTSKFKNTGIERDIEYLFVGVISEAKGLSEMRGKLFKEKIVFIGDCAKGVKLDFGEYIGKVPYDMIPHYMNRAKNFIFLPRWPEPQGRVVAEAALCGCNIIGNENIGALSFNEDLSSADFYREIESGFWNKILNTIK